MSAEYAAALPYPVGDTLCYANYPEYSSKFRVSVSLGGAVADTAWIDPGQPPIICVHAPYDKTTPCGEDYVYVGDQRIVEVQGSCVIAPLANAYGNNACLSPPHFTNDFQQSVTDVAESRSGGVDNLLLILGDTISDGNPWNFWNKEEPDKNVNSELGLLKNPYMSREKAERYIDTILAFVLPRLYQCMDFCIVATDEPGNFNDTHIIMYPNPAYKEVFIGTGKNDVIRNISVFDMKGALLERYSDINFNYFYLPVDKLIPGQYILKFQFDQGFATRKIIVN